MPLVKQKSLLYIASFIYVASAATIYQTITLRVPVGTTVQEGLICYPYKWYTIIGFFLGNYVSHAATVRSDPGAPLEAYVLKTVLSLFFPGGAAFQGFAKLNKWAIQAKSPLKRACIAKALCTVARKYNWDPVDGQYIVPDDKLSRHEKQEEGSIGLEEIGMSIHGSYKLPVHYTIVPVHPLATVTPICEGIEETLSSSYSLTKALVAIIQLILSITTLVKTRGDQIEKYGYAAFGLTVTPFAVGSLVNLISGLVTPEYDCLYLVRSNAMIEAESINGVHFDAVIGKAGSNDLIYPDGAGPNRHSLDKEIGSPGFPVVNDDWGVPENPYDGAYRKPLTIARIIVTLAIILTPIAIIGGLSGFERGQSTAAQRVWVMGWIATGQFFSLYMLGVTSAFKSFKQLKVIIERRYELRESERGIATLKSVAHAAGAFTVMVPFSAFAIGGYVVVFKMLLEYGNCEYVG